MTHCRNGLKCVASVVALYLVLYIVGGGRFTADDFRGTLAGLAIAAVFGLPAMFTFRYVVRWLAAATRLPGWGAVVVGLVLTFSAVVGLVLVTPPKIGMASLPLALIGGIFGALDAMDRSRARQNHVRSKAA